MERPAGFWLRFFAFLIDAAILSLFNWLIASLVDNGGGLYHLLSVLAGWLYFAGFESSANQATLGKQILHLKVTDLSGNPLSFGRATGRHFAKILSSLIFLIGYFMIAFTDRKQGLHDMIARTLVIKRTNGSFTRQWENEDSGYYGDR